MVFSFEKMMKMFNNLSIKCIFAPPILKMKKFKVPYILLAFVLFSSCQGYNKLLKSGDVDLKYRKGIEYYNKGDYVRAGTLFDMIGQIYRGTQRADTVGFYYAYCLYKQEDFIMAGHYFKEFADAYPRSRFAEEADYLNCYCYYLNSPRPELDQESTDQALDALQLFELKYPQSTRINECNRLIQDLRERLMTKDYINSKLYFDLGYYKAAVITIRNSLTRYPDSKYREDLMYLLFMSNYLFAENSVLSKQKERYQNALDDYYSFVAEFPKTKYATEVQKAYKNLAEQLKL